MKYFSVILLFFIFFFLTSQAQAHEEGDFFRMPRAVLWTQYSDDELGGSRSYVLEIKHGIDSSDILPDFFGQLGLIPSEIVGNIEYESSPKGEQGDAIWTHVTAYYDNLFGYHWLQGRALYKDILLDSYLGAGAGFVPTDNVWTGAYYLGSKGYEVALEGAYHIMNKTWGYGTVEYYTEGERLEGEIGFIFDDYIHFAVENRKDSFIYKLGISQIL